MTPRIRLPAQSAPTIKEAEPASAIERYLVPVALGAVPGTILGGIHGAIAPGHVKDEQGNYRERSPLMGGLRGALAGGAIGGTAGAAGRYLGERRHVPLPFSPEHSPKANKLFDEYLAQLHDLGMGGATENGRVLGAVTAAGGTLGAIHGAINPGASRDDSGNLQERSRLMGALRGGLGGAAVGGAAGALAGEIAGSTHGLALYSRGASAFTDKVQADTAGAWNRAAKMPTELASVDRATELKNRDEFLKKVHARMDERALDRQLQENMRSEGGPITMHPNSMKKASNESPKQASIRERAEDAAINALQYAAERTAKYPLLHNPAGAALIGAVPGAVAGGIHGAISPGYAADDQGKYHQRSRLTGALRGAAAGGAIGGVASGGASLLLKSPKYLPELSDSASHEAVSDAAADLWRNRFDLGDTAQKRSLVGALNGGAMGATYGAMEPGVSGVNEDGTPQQRSRLMGALRGGLGGTLLGGAAAGAGAAAELGGKHVRRTDQVIGHLSRLVPDDAPPLSSVPKQASFLGLNPEARAFLSNVGGRAQTGAAVGGLYGLLAPGYTQDDQGNYVQRHRLLGAARGAAAGAAVGGISGGLAHHLVSIHPDVVGKASDAMDAMLEGVPAMSSGSRLGALTGIGLGAAHGALDPGAERGEDGKVHQRDRTLGAVRGAIGGGLLGSAAGGNAVRNNLVGQIREKFYKQADWRSSLAQHAAGLGSLRAPLRSAASSAVPGAIMGGLYGALSPGYTQDAYGRPVQKSRLAGALGGAVTGGLVGGVSGGLSHYVQPHLSAQFHALTKAPAGAAPASVAAAVPKVAEDTDDGYPAGTKQADWKTEFARRATGAGGLAGIGMGVGTLAGAAHGALTNKDDQGNAAPISGAVSGALRGAQVGLLGGAAVGALKPQWGTSALGHLAGRDDSIGKMVRFGGRQVRSLTGVGDTKVLRGGLYDAEQALQRVQSNAAKLPPEVIQRAQQRVDVLRDTHERGLDHLPGLVSAVRKDGLLPTMGRTISTQWHGGDAFDKTMLVGGAALPFVSAALTPDDGTGTGKNWGGAVGEAFSNLITPAHLPAAGTAVTGLASAYAGRALGSGVDMARRAVAPRPQPPQLPPPGYAPQAPMVG